MKKMFGALMLVLIPSLSCADDLIVVLRTSLGQLNKEVSTGVVRFKCPILSGPAAWIIDAPDATDSVTVGPVNFETGKVTVTLHSPNAPSEFLTRTVIVRAVCAPVEE